MERKPITSRKDHSSFWDQIFREPTISREDETALAKAWRDEACQKSLNRLIMSHARVAKRAAMTFRNYGIAEEDLASAGLLGLTMAAHRFDPDVGVRFITYARYWVAESIRDAIVQQISTVRTSERQSRRILFGGEAHNAEREGIPFCIPLHGEDDADPEASPAAKIASPQDSPEQIVADLEESQLRQKWIQQALETLTARDRQIAVERLLSDPPKTYQAIGEEIGLTRERVRQIEKQVTLHIAKTIKALAAGEVPPSSQKPKGIAHAKRAKKRANG